MLRILDNRDSSKIGINYSSSGFSPTIRNYIYDRVECQFAICETCFSSATFFKSAITRNENDDRNNYT